MANGLSATTTLATEPVMNHWQSRRRWFTILLVLYWLGMFTGTHWPLTPHPGVGVVDKWMHFGAFVGLSWLLSAVASFHRPISASRIIAIVAGLSAYALFDEWSQKIVGRDCELFDWCADVVGALVGSGAFAALALVWRRREKPTET